MAKNMRIDVGAEQMAKRKLLSAFSGSDLTNPTVQSAMENLQLALSAAKIAASAAPEVDVDLDIDMLSTVDQILDWYVANANMDRAELRFVLWKQLAWEMLSNGERELAFLRKVLTSCAKR